MNLALAQLWCCVNLKALSMIHTGRIKSRFWYLLCETLATSISMFEVSNFNYRTLSQSQYNPLNSIDHGPTPPKIRPKVPPLLHRKEAKPPQHPPPHRTRRSPFRIRCRRPRQAKHRPGSHGWLAWSWDRKGVSDRAACCWTCWVRNVLCGNGVWELEDLRVMCQLFYCWVYGFAEDYYLELDAWRTPVSTRKGCLTAIFIVSCITAKVFGH